MSAHVTLNVHEGQLGNRQLRVEGASMLIVGRGSDCGLVLTDRNEPPAISRRHCAIKIDGERVAVADLGSKNGTLLNGRALPRGHAQPGAAQAWTPVASGDRVQLGDIAIEVVIVTPRYCTACGRPMEVAGGTETCGKCSATVAGVVAPPAPAPQPAPAAAPAPRWPRIAGFTIDCELGRGGMGVVYRARGGGRTVALKTILPGSGADDQTRASFMREAALGGQLDHPNIVAIHDVGVDGDLFWLATEYCAGGSLDAHVARHVGPLAIPAAVGLALQALDGIAYAHTVELTGLVVATGRLASARGLVHRDLKPQNLFLGGPDLRTVKIGDYGLAKAYELAGFSGATATGTVGGTPYFMSRRQVVDYKYAGPDADVWSLAATLYFLLTGEPPRNFRVQMSWMEVVMTTRAVPVRTRRPDVPPSLALLLDRALDDTGPPAYQTAAALADDLRTVVPGAAT